MKKLLFTLLAFSCCTFSDLLGANIGLLIMATGRYISFVHPLINSADRYFCTNHNVTYFVFTDSDLPSTDRIIYLPQKRLGWPFDTMMRGHTYASYAHMFEEQDYLFACDADMLFVGNVGDEILGQRVATQHPGFFGKRGSYENNPRSKACVLDHEGSQYFAGGFYGGTTEEMLRIFTTNAKNIDDDLQYGMIAVWHDESHWNRYCIDNPPTVILTPSYCYPEDYNLPYLHKLIALNKNHKEIRKD